MRAASGPLRAASAAVDRLGRVGRAGEGHAGDARIGHQRGADLGPVARQQMQHIPRHPGAMHQLDRAHGDERGLLRGLGDDGIAGGQRRGDLAGENGEGEIPGADAGEDPAPRQLELVALAGRAGQIQWLGEIGARALGVVAQEIHRLAHLRERIGNRLARLAHRECHQPGAILLHQIGGAFQALRPRLSPAAIPIRLRAHRPRQGLIDRIGPGLGHFAHPPAAVGGIEDGSGRTRTNRAADQGRGAPGLGRGPGHRLGQRQQPRHIGQVDAAGIAPLRAEQAPRARESADGASSAAGGPGRRDRR